MTQLNPLVAFLGIFLLSYAEPTYAQIQVTFPTSRIVFQRNSANQATLFLAGRCPPAATQVQARVVVRQSGTATAWTTVDANPQNGVFSGQLTGVSGGWYNLEIAAFAGGNPLGTTLVERVGVGEVFVTAGQSNAWGGSFAEGQATDERVCMIGQPAVEANGAGVFDEARLSLTGVPATLDSGKTNGLAPCAPLFMWGALGDRLVQRLGVPVMFFGASHPATRSTDWLAAATGTENVGNGFYTRNAPYRSLGASILHYLKRTGVRAVLWHQGESDNYYRTRQEYIDQIGTVIQKTRNQLGFGVLSWVVSRVSYLPGTLGPPYDTHETDPDIIDAQNVLSTQRNNWPGPATDEMIYPDYRVADQTRIHFGAADCIPLADVWNQALTTGFFTNVQPSLPNRLILLTTGYVFPFTPAPGQSVEVPYVSAVPVRQDNQYAVDLLTASGCLVTRIGSSTANPIAVVIPEWANGRYRLRVSATSPAVIGEPGEVITVNGSGSGVPPGQTAGTVTSLRAGYWNDPAVWSCGNVPAATDMVQINHAVTVPATTQVQVRQLHYGAGSRLIYEVGGRLVLGSD